MELTITNIPREYLALKINYCRQQLIELPAVRMQVSNVNGIATKKLVCGKHRNNLNTPAGERLLELKKRRDYYACQLRIYEAVWDAQYKCDFPPECYPHKVIRTMYTDTYEKVSLDREFFDSLVNDSNTDRPKPTYYPFNGILYRSSAERKIAILYTSLGIPFKYEPAVMLKGLNRPIHPDFVLYIRELDNCKFHEHFGVRQSSNYLKETSFKYNNYTHAGLVPETDIIFTHDVEEIPFDIRSLTAKLNTAVYTTLLNDISQGRQTL
ncbi:MAG: hypothetical protein IKQ81_08975 [Clostridiales bacterium]|nr:hypothetical protein [Clostridiales bacterium]